MLKRNIKKIRRYYIIDNGMLCGDEASKYNKRVRNWVVLPSIKPDGSDRTMYDLLVHAGFYPSIKHAKRAWTKTGEAIPDGYNTYTIESGSRIKELTIVLPYVKQIGVAT